MRSFRSPFHSTALERSQDNAFNSTDVRGKDVEHTRGGTEHRGSSPLLLGCACGFRSFPSFARTGCNTKTPSRYPAGDPQRPEREERNRRAKTLTQLAADRLLISGGSGKRFSGNPCDFFEPFPRRLLILIRQEGRETSSRSLSKTNRTGDSPLEELLEVTAKRGR